MTKSRTQKLVLCALFAALTAVLSQIVIPIGPVPINLATFAVFCAGAFLGARLGAISMTVWVVLGAVGVPVYTMFRGGPGVLMGPTGGYIVGYVAAAFLIGLVVERWNQKNDLYRYGIAMLLGSITYFAIGTAWFMFIMNTSLIEAMMTCVLPFIPGDLFKIAAAAVLVKKMKPALMKA